MLDEGGDDVALEPLVVMNPMGKDHVAVPLDFSSTQDAVASR